MKLTDYEKDKIESQCQPLIEKLQSHYVSKNPDKKYNYLVNIYLKWYRNNLYFCGKYKSESPDRIADEFEDKFVRLKSTGKDKFDFSYMRHTGQWSLVASDLTLNECLEMIENTPTFHPIG
ncbi:hypothetical protein BMS3Bbin03_01920 [bacterium BMS3Bbin03]|nr:hypothetical protein BMS3Bbin03_01920 [bacterium BMS3Bbin03]